MKIKTLFFGITADLVDASELEIDAKEKISITGFKALLKDKFIQLENIDSYAIAINEEYATDENTLEKGDVVAIIPPVSGG